MRYLSPTWDFVEGVLTVKMGIKVVYGQNEEVPGIKQHSEAP